MQENREISSPVLSHSVQKNNSKKTLISVCFSYIICVNNYLYSIAITQIQTNTFPELWLQLQPSIGFNTITNDIIILFFSVVFQKGGGGAHRGFQAQCYGGNGPCCPLPIIIVIQMFFFTQAYPVCCVLFQISFA